MFLKKLTLKKFASPSADLTFDFENDAFMSYFSATMNSRALIRAAEVFLSYVVNGHGLYLDEYDCPYALIKKDESPNIIKSNLDEISIEGTVNIDGKDFTYIVSGTGEDDPRAADARKAFYEWTTKFDSTPPLIRLYYNCTWVNETANEDNSIFNNLFAFYGKNFSYYQWNIANIRLEDIYHQLVWYEALEKRTGEPSLELKAFNTLFTKYLRMTSWHFINMVKAEVLPISGYLVCSISEKNKNNEIKTSYQVINSMDYIELKKIAIAMDLILRAVNLNSRICEDNTNMGGIVICNELNYLDDALSELFPKVQIIWGQ